ncbi:MAG TPA: glycosyltransferase family 9 protein [Syntrophorhabdaceae bacterium]|nr:glycosyltransferase family 9 protein [Syntrophorhabdaceae bacterium]
MDKREVLIVHLGGLGDVCLSESVFYSLRTHFDDNLTGLGNKRFLGLFQEYFDKTEGIESRKWLYLFSEKLGGPFWKQIVFIGKDTHGILRKRWQQFSGERLIFIDMYQEGTYGEASSDPIHQKQVRERLHIEDYQLLQLKENGIQPLKKAIIEKKAARVILYPERGFTKEKWPPDKFLELHRSLEKRGIDVTVQQPLGLVFDVGRKVSYEDLAEVKQFYSEGGVFVSNDSGMAHLAGACGLFTITIFTDFDPHIWRPRGQNSTITQENGSLEASTVEKSVLEVLSRSGVGVNGS